MDVDQGLGPRLDYIDVTMIVRQVRKGRDLTRQTVTHADMLAACATAWRIWDELGGREPDPGHPTWALYEAASEVLDCHHEHRQVAKRELRLVRRHGA